MSGIAGCFFTEQAAPAAAANIFAGLNDRSRAHLESDAAMFVSGSSSDLVETSRYVLAVEGYIVNIPDAVSRTAFILESFEKEGAAFFEKLAGGYGVIIWDKYEKTATLRTCRFGQRNFYRCSAGRGLVFASDLRALKELTGRRFELDPETAWMSFLYGGVYGAGTPLKDVARVLPGSTLVIRRELVTENLARDIPRDVSGRGKDRHSHLMRLDAVLRRAVSRLGKVGDSYGVMVGSGVDSSLVAAYARDEVGGVAAITQKMPEELDESASARRIVDALGIRHRLVPYEIDSRDLVEDLSRFVRIAEEPAYWNQLGPAVLRLLEPDDRPRCILTGAEGDFLFNFRSRTPTVAGVVRYGLFGPVAWHTARRLLNKLTRHTYITGADFDLLDRSLMREHVAVDCSPAGSISGFIDPTYPHLPAGPNAQRHFINNGWQNVRIIAQLGRETGSEVLFPFLDDDVVAAVLSLPEELKINKIALRLLLRRFLRGSTAPRKKRGYWAHTIKWHYEAGRLQSALDLMSDRRTAERGVYRPSAVRNLVGKYAKSSASSKDHPVFWQLLVFEIFCREFVDA